MSVRAKFKCVDKTSTVEATNIKLEPVIYGSAENESFYRWTPSGAITLGCVNDEASDHFEEGKEYYVDFQLAETSPQDTPVTEDVVVVEEVDVAEQVPVAEEVPVVESVADANTSAFSNAIEDI